MNKNGNDCLVCLFKNIYGEVLEPIIYICSHDKKNNFGELKVKKWMFYLHWLLLLFNVATSATILLTLLQEKSTSTIVLSRLHDFLFCSLGCMVNFWKLTIINHCHYVNGYLKIQEDKSFCIMPVSIAKDIERMSRSRFIYLCVLCPVLLVAGYTEARSPLGYTTCQIASLVMSIYHQLQHAFALNMYLKVFSVLSNVTSHSIRNNLLQALALQDRQLFYGDLQMFYDYGSGVSSAEKLRRHCRLLMAVNCNNDMLSTFGRAILLVWLLSLTADLSVLLYLMSRPDEISTGQFLKFTAIVTVISCLFVWSLVSAEDANSCNNEILSFLFKYPISRLSRTDATQVEMLISTLTLQKPVVRASDTVVIGTRLLASISGTVLTYVLVALQFRAAWTEN